MFSFNLLEMTTFRKHYLLTVSGGSVGFSSWVFVLLLLIFLPLPLSFNIHFNLISEQLRGALLLICTE